MYLQRKNMMKITIMMDNFLNLLIVFMKLVPALLNYVIFGVKFRAMLGQSALSVLLSMIRSQKKT